MKADSGLVRPSRWEVPAARLPRWLWVALLVLFPGIVGFHAWRTLEMLDTQREIFLRSRVAALTARVESLPVSSEGADADWAMALYEEEPSLLDAEIVSATSPDAAAAEIYAGRELYRLEEATRDGEAVVRAWFPAHRGGELQVVRLDFSASAADFLSAYASQSIALVAIIALALMALSAYTFRLAIKAAHLERRQAEREHLTQLGEMAAVLAHEIRNPLGSIKGFGQLLQESGGAQERDFAGEIVEQSGRIERLVNDLLLFGRVPEPRIASVSWDRIAERLRQAWERETHPENPGAAKVLLVLQPEGPTLATDEALLEQALFNLVRNARDAAAAPLESREESPSVAVSLTQERSAIAIHIEDNGPGLSQEALARLYEPFFTTKAFGTGLGLPTTRKLVGALGGELQVGNRRGGGMLATIRLPIGSREVL